MSEKIIMADSPEAASIQTVTGWVSRTGHFFGDDERAARYNGCTHRTCDCGAVLERQSYCKTCCEVAQNKKWASLPRKEWDGESVLYSQAADAYFEDLDALADHCVDTGCRPESLQLIICTPNRGQPLDEDYFIDEMPDDGDIDIPDCLREAIEAFNTAILSSPVLSWSPGEFAPTDESIAIDNRVAVEP